MVGHIQYTNNPVADLHRNSNDWPDPVSFSGDLGEERMFFVVINQDNRLAGSLPELFIIDAIKNNKGALQVADFMSDKIEVVHPDTPLSQVYGLMQGKGLSIVGVGDGVMTLEVIDREALSRFLELQSKLK